MAEMTPQETAERLRIMQCQYPHIRKNDAEWEAIEVAASYLRKIAAGEYKQVVHGQWINFVGDFSTAECDKCGEAYEVSPDEKPCRDYFNAFKQFYKFCPNCGAIMDGGEKHE